MTFRTNEGYDEERVSFLKNDGTKVVRHSRGALAKEPGKEQNRDASIFRRTSRSMLIAVALFVCAIAALASSRLVWTTKNWDTGTVEETNDSLYRCPAIDTSNKTNESGESFEDIYGVASRNMTLDPNEFLATFRTKFYDGWHMSYNKNKAGLADFKAKYFGPYVKSGTKLYESACGIGLNLFMTLEILKELGENTTTFNDTETSDAWDGTGVTVYGNEYVRESVEQSTMVLGENVLPSGNERGIICTADSTHLGFVPSNTFDVVFTGYITPLQDPLGIDPTDEWEKYDDICNSLNQNKTTATDWMGEALWKMVVQKQHDWYGKWVGEMARIAKPGAPIIVEQVSKSYCTNQYDWGGVDNYFWFQAATENTYDWNVDPSSIETVRDTLHSDRYHVFMLKKGD